MKMANRNERNDNENDNGVCHVMYNEKIRK
jgi:hypothetical protein